MADRTFVEGLIKERNTLRSRIAELEKRVKEQDSEIEYLKDKISDLKYG